MVKNAEDISCKHAAEQVCAEIAPPKNDDSLSKVRTRLKRMILKFKCLNTVYRLKKKKF